jgi:hypothetical protein
MRIRFYFFEAGCLLLCLFLPAWGASEKGFSDERAVLDKKENIFYSQEADPQEWEKWFKAQKSYIEKTQGLFREVMSIERNFYAQIRTADVNYNGHRPLGIVNEALAQIYGAIDKIEAINEPEELALYHGKIIASCRHIAKSIKAFTREGPRYASYKITSITMAMDAVSSLRQVYGEHGASQKELDDLSQIIEEGLPMSGNF